MAAEQLRVIQGGNRTPRLRGFNILRKSYIPVKRADGTTTWLRSLPRTNGNGAA